MSHDNGIERGKHSASRRNLRRAVIALGGVLALVTLICWAARDLPRRWLERRLATMLDAEVTLARLEIDSLHHVVLGGVEVRQVRWESRVERIAIERLDVEAPLRAALGGRYEKLTLDGVEVWLVPPAWTTQPAPRSEFRASEIEIRRGRLVVASGSDESALEFRAILANWGGEPSGHVSLTAERFASSALVGLAPGGPRPALEVGAETLRVEAALEPGPELLRLDVEAGRLRLAHGSRVVDLPEPRLAATGVRDEKDGSLLLRFSPSVAGIEAAALEVQLDGESFALRSGHADLRGIDLARLLGTAGALPDPWMVAGLADLRLTTEDGRTLDYELDTRLDRLELPLDAVSVRGERVQASARGRWAGETETPGAKPLSYELEATSGTLRVATGSTELSLPGVRLRSTGRLDTTGGAELRARLTLPRGRAVHEGRELPENAFPFEASLDGTLAFATAPSFDGVSDILSPALGRLRIRGRTVVEAGRTSADWRWAWSDAPGLPALRRTAAELRGDVLPSGIDVDGSPSATGTLRGALSDPRVTGELTIAAFEVSSMADLAAAWKLDQAGASAGFSRGSGDGARLDVERLQVEGRAEVGPWNGELSATATGWTDFGSGELQVDDGRIELPGLASLQAGGRLAADGGVDFTARVEPVDLVEIRALSHLWREDPAPGYTMQGAAAARLDASRSPQGDWQATGELELTDVGFGSPDATRVLEGAGARWHAALSARADGRIEGEATAALTAPVMLWGTLFGDFSPLASTLRVNVVRDGGRWQSTADWDLPNGVAVRGRLADEPESGRLDYGVTADLPDLDAFLDRYVRGPFEGSVEHLDTLGAAGHLRVDLSGVLEDGRRTIEGTVAATGASFTGLQGANGIEGLTLALPVSLGWEADAAGIVQLVAGTERKGSLAYERLRLGGLEFPPLDTSLVVTSDTARLDRPLDFALLDGRVELRQVALARWSRPDRELRFGLRLDGLSLATLARELDGFPLEGTLSGTFPAVRLTPERMQVDGGGTIELFGGAVEVFDISGQDILGRYPKLQFSARLDGVRLLDVTRTFDFGEVYGVVDGEIRDCELFGGTPVRCAASLASVKTKGVPQKISVKAIRNISIIGAGPRVGFLDRGLQRFLDTYTYSRLGFTMELDHDRFRLRGTERRGTHELFVKGRPPFRIDIVNAAPGQTVSFQTMMNRLRNLEVQAPPPR